jgi:hypothetical protein
VGKKLERKDNIAPGQKASELTLISVHNSLIFRPAASIREGVSAYPAALSNQRLAGPQIR